MKNIIFCQDPDIKRKMKVVYDLMADNEDDIIVNKILDRLIAKLSKKHRCIRIIGVDIAQDVDMIITEDILNNVAKGLYKNKDYDYTKYLWLHYPNGEEKRLDSIVEYDN